jgi:hypothetical protein
MTHIEECRYCGRQVAQLIRAARDFEDRRRVARAFGSLAGRVGACVRISVDAALGAFTRMDALVQGVASSARLVPTLAPAGATRGDGDDGEGGGASEEPFVREAVVEGEGLPVTDVLCSRVRRQGALTVSVSEPVEIRLLGPDGTVYELPVDEGDDRHYAMMADLPAGDYLLTLLRPEAPAPDRPSA